ncbi:peptidylprolyl isomerase [Parvularcula oceani]|uniref:peptidylprolyl isomerase n=1 Tax=Parvularcula oceani TaxID=1247963 RepID=UPI0004E172CC|nr:peptidylprolyl isomerase [Parvularcula oceani]
MLVESLLALVALADPLPGRATVAEILEAAPEEAWVRPDPEDTLYLDLDAGRVVIAMVPELAPAHAAQIRTLAREGYYEGLSFYRVVEGFVAQGGDEAGTKDIGSAKPALPAEFEMPLPEGVTFTPLGQADPYSSQAGFIESLPAARDPQAGTAWLAHCTGAFAFGREEGRDTASTEIYIALQPQRYLDQNLTVLGRVILGMEHVQAMPRGELGNAGTIADEGRWTPIRGMTLAADLPEEARVPVEIMDTSSETFAQLIEARAARPSGFFYHRPDHVDLCQMPVPVRLAP